jgi:DNA repair protein RadC
MGKTGKVHALERELAEHFASLCLDNRPERMKVARWIARRETLALAEPVAPAAAQPAAEALPTLPDTRLHRIPVYDVRLVQSRSPLMLASPVAADSETSARALHSLIGLTDREHFVALFVNGGNHITGAHIAAIGGQHGIGCVDSRVILRTALAACASAIVLGHNHPSGDPSPSPEDITTTMHLMRAAQAVTIPVIDHVIVTRDPRRFYSMLGHDALPAFG